MTTVETMRADAGRSLTRWRQSGDAMAACACLGTRLDWFLCL